MKKILLTISTILTCMAAPVFATGEDASGITISQVELVDYVIYAGIAVFLIGMIFVLLALFLKHSPKEAVLEDEEYDLISEDIPLPEDNYQASEDLPEQPEDDAKAAIAAEEDADGGPDEEESETEVEEPAVPEEMPVIPQEPIVVPEEDASPEEPHLPPVRLTLTGMNNPDLKILEFTESATLGRRSTNDLMISDNAVSGTHCKLTYDGDVVYIEDLNSTNGTIVNGSSVTNTELKSGDVLIVGKKQYKITIS